MFSAKTFFSFLLGFLVAGILARGSVRNAWSQLSAKVGGWSAHAVSGKDIQVCDGEKAWYIFDVLQQAYYHTEDLDAEKMQEAAIKGYVEAIGDPHTEYLTPEENKNFAESMEGSQHFEGIGAVVSKKRDGIMIAEVLKWSPAFNAGLQPLDIILKIGDETTSELELGDAVKKIRGPKDTAITLTIFRQREDTDEPEVFDVDVTRGPIDVPSVRLTVIPVGKGKAAHIEVAIFGEDTISKIRELLLATQASFDAVILDVRGNGGGYLPTAVELASFFLPKNELVTTTKYSVLPDEVHRSAGYADIAEKPVVVLVDGMSASASEIVAWALKQRANAVLVGTKTFGKWSVQTIQPLDDGSMLKYTIGNRYLPDGSTIDKVGIEPDVTVEIDRDARIGSWVDAQLDKAKEVLLDPQVRKNQKACCGG